MTDPLTKGILFHNAIDTSSVLATVNTAEILLLCVSKGVCYLRVATTTIHAEYFGTRFQIRTSQPENTEFLDRTDHSVFYRTSPDLYVEEKLCDDATASD